MAQHPGMARLRVLTPRGAWVNVGPFATLPAARRFGHALAQQGEAVAVRVEHRNRGTWRPAWTWRGAALVGVVALALTGCAAPPLPYSTHGDKLVSDYVRGRGPMDIPDIRALIEGRNPRTTPNGWTPLSRADVGQLAVQSAMDGGSAAGTA